MTGGIAANRARVLINSIFSAMNSICVRFTFLIWYYSTEAFIISANNIKFPRNHQIIITISKSI